MRSREPGRGAYPIRPDAAWLAAVGAVAVTYGYFLIFAEFALLELVRAIAAERLRLVMAALGAGGVAGAVLGARAFAVVRQRAQLAWAFRASAGSAVAGVVAPTLPWILAAATAVGVSLGWLTVALTASLRSAMGGRRLGVGIGLGTGLAYAACNLPALFQASASAQAIVAAAAAALASFLPRWMHGRAVEPARGGDYAPAGVTRWIVVLLALVWLDSAAFYIVQHTPELQAATWGGGPALLTNAAVHLVAAVAAGVALDRGWPGRVAAAGALALIGAGLILSGVMPALIPAGWLYTAGVSFYSTVLVAYPARSGRPGVAALVFALAGWVGSALGIGMAQDLGRIPVAFVVTAGAAIVGALGWRAWGLRALVTGAVLAASGGRAAEATETERATVARGREVYVAEGCMHCHSQYVRPGVALDVERWGPASTLAQTLAGAPPLPGNRRQGPDLANVGNRRWPEWNRLHLIAPREVSPGSRMPSYAHLFAAGDGRGDALVAYLASLGAETRGERWQQNLAWTPRTAAVATSERARGVFRQLCTPCHGETGRGDGPVAARLSFRPADWTQGPWRHGAAEGDAEVRLSRIIKFGLPGLPMAGHEYLPDGDVVGLARFVQTLHNSGSGGGSVAARP